MENIIMFNDIFNTDNNFDIIDLISRNFIFHIIS